METESKSMLQARSKQPALIRHTHTALTVPELLVTIFSWLSKADLARVARVCRFWTPFALEKIWETIPDLQYLMKLYSIIAQKAGVSWLLLQFA
ncbi:hypothetical protein M407DRAFT_34876 [Tulasnella calospora MUT 4182]|uniref:F-box domain-containing protein n=1 Tax=Tulasnella calospora MUT 4182 TaxID=1051891 RepID=A0A0C3PZX2_9AGAM|nr:hypothetical protein M407DRAFT_34876 [Tulasnella calospora MUT 4182]